MANVMLEIFRRFLFGMSPNVLAFKVRGLQGTLNFIGVNDISRHSKERRNSIPTQHAQSAEPRVLQLNLDNINRLPHNSVGIGGQIG